MEQCSGQGGKGRESELRDEVGARRNRENWGVGRTRGVGCSPTGTVLLS